MFVDDLFNKKTLTESNGGGSPWHSEPEQQQMDADRRGRLGRERNAGLDEPDDAASGSAPTGNGVYEYTVPAGQESVAQQLGLQQHKGHWVSRVPIQRANFQFGRPQFHEIPTQGVAEGSKGSIPPGSWAWQDGYKAGLKDTTNKKPVGAYAYVDGWKAAKRDLVKKQGVAEAATPASTSKVLRLIQRHHSDWFDTYGIGEVEDAVVDMAEMGQFQGMSAEDAVALVAQELDSLYGAQGMAEGSSFPGAFSNRDVESIRKLQRSNRDQSSTPTAPHQRSDWFDPASSVSTKKQKLAYLKSKKQQGTNEGLLDSPGESDSPVAQAIIRRILLQRTDLLSKYGPEKVGSAVDEVADFVGDVDEIGSSDVSGWVRHVEQMLGNMGEGVAESAVNTKSIITESKTYKLWESAGQKLVEAQLTADQINQIFQQVEQGATAAGGNRTMLGKGKDAAGAVNRAWEDLKTKVQSSGPIKGVDAMYDKAAEQLKQATGGDQGVMTYVQKYRDFAKKHPVAQSLIYSALIAAAGISGAGLGGAAALGLFKLVDKLLQGEKFSSAAYSGAKTGAMAYGASKVADLIKGTGSGSGSAPQGPNVDDKIAAARARVDAANAKLGIDGSSPNFDVTGNVAQGGLAAVRQQAGNEALKAVQQAIANGANPKLQSELADVAQAVLEKYSTLQGGPLSVQTAETLAQKIAMQAASSAGGLKESVELTESQIFLMFGKIVNRQRKLDEGIMDTIKGAAGKAVDWAKTKGTNLTTKITADKLLQAWKKAGSPTDSLDVAKVIQNAGVPSASIKQVYNTMKIPFAGEPGAQPAMTRKIDVDSKPTATTPAAATTPATTSTASTAATTVATTPAASKSGIQTGATALIDPDTDRPYEKDKLAAMYGYKEPEAAADDAQADETPPAPVAQTPAQIRAAKQKAAAATAQGQMAGAAPAPVAQTPAATTATNPVGFNASNVMKLPGMEKYAKPAAPAKTANFAGPGGYGKTTTSIKPPAAPSSPALAVPKAPAVPKVTSGGPTPAEKAALDKRIAAAAAAAPAVAETLAQVERMLESVNSKKSADMIRAYVDQRFTELGLRNTQECRNLMTHVVQESAIRRRQYAKSLAN